MSDAPAPAKKRFEGPCFPFSARAKDKVILPVPLNATSSPIDRSTTVVLRGSDDVLVAVSAAAIKKESKLLSNMLPEEGPYEDDVPVPNVDGETLQYIVAFAEYHENNPFPKLEKPLKLFLFQLLEQKGAHWLNAFIYTDLIKDGDELYHDKLVKVMVAAAYLECNKLHEITTAAFASMLRFKDRVLVRERLFGLTGDYTPEEWSKIEKEYAWVFQEAAKK
eukprot:PhF_6_TR6018/c0_g1_i1/m.8665/K03094/SKP1, CBF3D; S-phase kinase-associated protein 1